MATTGEPQRQSSTSISHNSAQQFQYPQHQSRMQPSHYAYISCTSARNIPTLSRSSFATHGQHLLSKCKESSVRLRIPIPCQALVKVHNRLSMSSLPVYQASGSATEACLMNLGSLIPPRSLIDLWLDWATIDMSLMAQGGKWSRGQL